MKAIVYSATGDPDVLRLTERPVPEPGPGEARVRVKVSGVNPTDWKARRSRRPAFPEVVPNQDGSGVIDAVGPGVADGRVGERMWLWEAARQRADGTAQEAVTFPARQAVPLPDRAGGARRRRCGCGGQRGDPARALGRRDRARKGQQSAEGGAGQGRRRPCGDQLPYRRCARRDPADRCVRRGHHGRDRTQRQRRAERGHDGGRRHGRGVRHRRPRRPGAAGVAAHA